MTIFPQQGTTALDEREIAAYPAAADLTVGVSCLAKIRASMN